MEIFKLFGSVFVDTKKAEESTHKLGDKVDSTGNKFISGVGKAVKWGAAISASAIAGGAALFKVAGNAAEAGDRVDKMSQKLGVSRKAFQELDFVMSQSGLSIDSFGTGMKSLLKQMDSAKNGNKEATSSFQSLGVAVTDSKGKLRSQEEVLYDSIKALQKMENGSEKARLAQKLFGKQGQDIMPLLNSQSGSIEELTAKAHELGIVMGDDAVEASVKLTDTLDQSKRAFQGIMTQVGVQVMPIFQKFLDFILQHMPQIKTVMSVVFGAVGSFVTTVADIFKDYLMPIIMGVVDWVKNNWSTISSVIGSVMDTVKTIIQTAWGIISAIWRTFGQTIIDYVQGAFNAISNIIQGVMNVIKGVINLVMSIIKGDWSGAWEGIKGIVGGVLQAIKGIISGVLNIIKSIIKGVWDGLVAVTSGAWNAIKNAITAPFKSAWDFIKGIVDKLKNIFNFKWSLPKIPLPHFSVKGSLNPIKWFKQGLPKLSVEWYAKGAIMKKPTMFGYDPYSNTAHVGGEAGPEAIAPIGTLQGYVESAVAKQNGAIEGLLIAILRVLEGLNSDLARSIREILEDYKIEVDDRELGRMVRKYAREV